MMAATLASWTSSEDWWPRVFLDSFLTSLNALLSHAEGKSIGKQSYGLERELGGSKRGVKKREGIHREGIGDPHERLFPTNGNSLIPVEMRHGHQGWLATGQAGQRQGMGVLVNPCHSWLSSKLSLDSPLDSYSFPLDRAGKAV